MRHAAGAEAGLSARTDSVTVALRLFIAWPLPAAISAVIEQRCAATRDQLPKASWVRPAGYHLTFAFLGDRPAEVVEGLADSMSRHLAGFATSEVRVTTPGFFPSERKPRVGWLAMEPKDHLGAIAAAVRAGVEAVGISLEERAFTAHLTLVRIKGRWRSEDCDRFKRHFSDFVHPPASMDHVALIRSELSSEGSRYTELHRVSVATD